MDGEAVLAPPPRRHRRRSHQYHRCHRLRHRRRRLCICHLRHRPPREISAQRRRPLVVTSHRRWRRLLHLHRRLGCWIHRRLLSPPTFQLQLNKVADGAAPILDPPHLPASHHGAIDCCVRRHLCYVDRRKEHLMLLFNCIVAARPVEDAAGGRRPAACMLLPCARACALQSRDPVPLSVILRLLPWRGGHVRQEPISSTSFWQGRYFPVQKHLGDSLHRTALCRKRVAWTGVVGHH